MENKTEAKPGDQPLPETTTPVIKEERLFLKALGVQIAKEEGDLTVGIDESKLDEIEEKPKPNAEDKAEAAPADPTPRPKLRRKFSQAPGIDAAKMERIQAASTPEQKPVEKPLFTATQAEDPDKDLQPADKAVVALARAVNPDLASEHREWIKQRDEFVREATADGGEFDVNSPEWRTFVRHNPPPINAAKRDELRDQKVAMETEQRVEAKFRVELERVKNDSERKFRELELKPAIAKEAKAAVASILMPEGEDDEVIKAMAENPEEAERNYSIEVPMVKQIVADTELVIGEWLQIANGIKDFDEKNPAHNWVAGFVEQKGREIDALPAEKRVRDGRVLVSRETYIRMMDGKHPDLENVSTLTKEDIMSLIKHEVKTRTREQLKSTRKWMEDRGLVHASRANVANATEAQPEPAARQAPRATPSRVPSPPSKPATSKRPYFLKSLGVNTK